MQLSRPWWDGDLGRRVDVMSPAVPPYDSLVCTFVACAWKEEESNPCKFVTEAAS